MAIFHKENTIQSRSSIYFNTPSDAAVEHLFYVQMYGHFVCDSRYSVLKRDPFESYLIMRTLQGSGTLITPCGEFVLQPGDIALVDCGQAHDYFANGYWEFQWFHFLGNASRYICRQFLESGGNVAHVTDVSRASQYIAMIADKRGSLTGTLDDEVRISALIHEILSEMLALGKSSHETRHRDAIAQAIDYIQRHYAERITVSGLADSLGMSNSSFSHLFKAKTGFSPYDYLINHRINQAKYLLWAHDLSVGEVSERVGFGSPANFIQKIREKAGVTPHHFRKGAM